MNAAETRALLGALRDALGRGQQAAIATVVGVHGSAYRREGTRIGMDRVPGVLREVHRGHIPADRRDIRLPRVLDPSRHGAISQRLPGVM